MQCLVLDAMGVMFRAADDVAELLVPFVIERGGASSGDVVQKAYLAASLGQITAGCFWASVGLDSRAEDAYLQRHRLTEGVTELLVTARRRQVAVWCLSNDVDQWSRKLRRSFGLESLLSGSVISGDVGVRKPDRRIYEVLMSRSGFSASDMLFVDDRIKNVAAARSLGIESLQYNPFSGFQEIAARLSAD